MAGPGVERMGKVVVAVLLMAAMVGGHLLDAFASDERTQQALVNGAVAGALPALETVEAHFVENRVFPAAIAASDARLQLAIDADTGTVSATYREDFKDTELNTVYPIRGRGVRLTPIVQDGRIAGWRCAQTLGYGKAQSCRDGQTVSARTAGPGA